MIKLSEEEKNRLIELAKGLMFKFTGYHKYVFSYEAECEGGSFFIEACGDELDLGWFRAKPIMTFQEIDETTFSLYFRVDDDITTLLEGEW